MVLVTYLGYDCYTSSHVLNMCIMCNSERKMALCPPQKSCGGESHFTAVGVIKSTPYKVICPAYGISCSVVLYVAHHTFVHPPSFGSVVTVNGTASSTCEGK